MLLNRVRNVEVFSPVFNSVSEVGSIPTQATVREVDHCLLYIQVTSCKSFIFRVLLLQRDVRVGWWGWETTGPV